MKRTKNVLLVVFMFHFLGTFGQTISVSPVFSYVCVATELYDNNEVFFDIYNEDSIRGKIISTRRVNCDSYLSLDQASHIIKEAYTKGFSYAKHKQERDIKGYERGLVQLKKELEYYMRIDDYKLPLYDYYFNMGYITHVKLKK